MDWKALGNAIVDYGAPLLGGAIAGPGGATLGKVVADMFGGDPNDPASLLENIQLDPEAGIKLAMMQSEERVRLREITAEQTKAYLADRQSARQREIELQKAGRTSWEMLVLAFLAIAGLIGIALVLFLTEVPDGAEEMLLMIIGALISRAGDVYAFYFGSSRGSKDKDRLLSERFGQGASNG
jgi:hypothetical protein